jgi:integrase
MQAQTVTIENHENRLRLRWAYQGERYTLAVGVPDNPTGRAIANQKRGKLNWGISG